LVEVEDEHESQGPTESVLSSFLVEVEDEVEVELIQ
jgi:hypothetical protein